MESFLTSAGYGAIILFGFLEACCVPISSEVTFGFAGVLAYQGHLSLALVIVIGSLAELAGSCTSFAVGRWGGRPLVDRVGRYVLITRSDVDRAERFLEGRGAWAVPVARMIPVVRAFTSIVAGLIEMPFARFAVLSAIGTVIYVTALSAIGYGVGSAWHSVAHDVSIIGYVVVALVVVAIVGLVVIRLRAFRREAAGTASAGPRHAAARGWPDRSARGRPDATPGRPDAAPGGPDAAPGGPDAAPGRLDAAPGGPDAAPGGPDGAPGGPAASAGEAGRAGGAYHDVDGWTGADRG